MNNFISFIHFTMLIFFLFNLPSSAQSENVESFLKGKVITDIKNDGVDIWVATEGNGIYKFSKSKNKWYNFSSENKIIKQDFFYCLEINKQFVWAGSADGLYIYDKRRNSWSKRKFGLGGQFGNWIRALQFDRYDNSLWIGRFKYLTKYDLKTKKYDDIDLTIGKNDKANSVKTIAIDGDSLLWVGVEAGLHKIIKNLRDSNGNEKIVYFDSKESYFMGESDQVSISKILPDKNFIWFGTDEFVTSENPEFNVGGLFRFDRKINWVKFSEYNKLNANGIFSLEETGNYIWASVYKFDPESKGAIGQGVFLINKKTLSIKKIESDIIPETILSMHFDGNNIWLGTNRGLYKVALINDLIPNFSR
ncbi:MAG: hypothetical protein KDC52_02185 [Ignavibacteriae bacterium]|nr:hypothetical protein [Ignavibacteriota bacterium]